MSHARQEGSSAGSGRRDLWSALRRTSAGGSGKRNPGSKRGRSFEISPAKKYGFQECVWGCQLVERKETLHHVCATLFPFTFSPSSSFSLYLSHNFRHPYKKACLEIKPTQWHTHTHTLRTTGLVLRHHRDFSGNFSFRLLFFFF